MENYYNDPNFRIAIYIGGNVVRGDGFGQIVSVGVLAGMEYEKLDASPISRTSTSENPVFTIKNTETYMLYKIWDDSVLISDVQNNGRLCIGMTIPARAKLKDGKSPYTLLMDIYHKFLELGTEPAEDGRRRFKKEELKKEDFQAIIDQYPIEYAPNRVAPMTGNLKGQLQITSTKDMEDFFRDTQYEEFTDYEAIEVTKAGFNMFPNLPIPNPKGYLVIVNGQPAKDPRNLEKEMILREGDERSFTARCEDTLDNRYEPLTISIAKLRMAPDLTLTSLDGTSKAMLDEAKQSIVCTLNPIAIWYKKNIKYDLKSDDEAKIYCKENMGSQIKILVNRHYWNNDTIKPSDVAEQKKGGKIELRKDIFSVSPNETDRYRFSVSNVEINDWNKEKQLSIYIKAEKKRTGNNQSSGSGLDFKSLLIGAVIGIALGVGGYWATQTILGNMQKNKIEKQEKGRETSAWNNLKDLTPRNPSQANLCRDYLRNFSNGENTISKGDDVRETIKGSFGYADFTHAANVKQKLQKYVEDSIQAEQDEEKAFNACVDIAACDNYLENYNLVQTHRYFEKGKHVEEVLNKKADLEKKQKEADDNKNKDDLNKAKNNIIKNVENTALEYLNKKDLIGFRNWLRQNNSEWKAEIKENKKNKDLLGDTKSNAVEWIVGYRNQKYKKTKEDQAVPLNQNQMQGIKTYLNSHTKPYNTWEDVMTTKKEIDKILSENAD